jgi:hypothetical protein
VKQTLITATMLALTLSLSACGGDDKTTVIHDRPVVVNSTPSGSVPSDVENSCRHGYDNSSHSCY